MQLVTANMDDADVVSVVQDAFPGLFVYAGTAMINHLGRASISAKKIADAINGDSGLGAQAVRNLLPSVQALTASLEAIRTNIGESPSYPRK